MSLDFNAHIIDEFRRNNGRLGGMFADARILLLTTTGARTGRNHTVPLVYFPDSGGQVLVVGSAAGAARHPAWYHNILANSTVTVENGQFEFEAIATVLTPEERDAAFARIAEADQGWADYQARTDRIIPVVALRPSGMPSNGSWGDRLNQIHDAFRRELALIRAEVARSGSIIGAQLRVNCLTLCDGLHQHHTSEDDGVFPLIAERNPELTESLRRLRDEHDRIKTLLDQLRQLLGKPELCQETLSTEVDRIIIELHKHLDYEEEQLIPTLNTISDSIAS